MNLWSILKFPSYGNLAKASPLRLTLYNHDRANTCFMNYTSYSTTIQTLLSLRECWNNIPSKYPPKQTLSSIYSKAVIKT